jgi:hypothetical protein
MTVSANVVYVHCLPDSSQDNSITGLAACSLCAGKKSNQLAKAGSTSVTNHTITYTYASLQSMRKHLVMCRRKITSISTLSNIDRIELTRTEYSKPPQLSEGYCLPVQNQRACWCLRTLTHDALRNSALLSHAIQ